MTKPATRTQSRENWLHAAIDMLRPMFVQIGAELPETIHISVGFSSKGKRVPVGPGGEPVKVTSGPATQTNRHLKVSCAAHPAYSVRASRTVLEMGMPACGICGGEMA
jgi:hypothetical protein